MAPTSHCPTASDDRGRAERPGRDPASVRRASRPGGDTDQQPRLVIDPFGRGLVLRLPAVGDAPDGSATWVVGLDASSQRVATRPLAPGLNEPAPQTDVAIAMPARIATIAMAGREDLTITLTVVDETDPLLAFGEDGVRLPAGLPLPGRPTWLLFPGDPHISRPRAPSCSRRVRCCPAGRVGACC